MIDLHTHILPGVDDGVQSLAEACELARAAAADGIRTLAATPHVREDFPTTAAEMETRLATVKGALAAAGIDVDVVGGAEIALDQLPSLAPEELRRLTIAQAGRYVLVEFPYYGWPLRLEYDLWQLRALGLTAIVAHPERNPEVQARPERLEGAVNGGAIVQLTTASLDGRLGKRSRRAATALLERGLAHLLASDAHSADVRAVGFSSARAVVKDPAVFDLLTAENPAALLAGEPVLAARP